MPEETVRIVQLIPADGWSALYWSSYEPYYELIRLISFALVEDSKGKRSVSGLDQFLYLCSVRKNFAEYVHVEKVTDEVKAQWSKTGRQATQG